MNRLNNKIVLITGASSGIGVASAFAFAERGARLILTARRFERLKKIAEDIQNKYKTDCFVLECDVSKPSSVNDFYNALPANWKNIDILINNAGLALSTDRLQNGNLDEWNQMIDTNIKGLLYITKCFLPAMIQKKSGHIINLGSVAGHGVYSGGAVYCATKYAVDAISKALRLDLGGTPIKVTEISPGMVESEFSLVRFSGDDKKAQAVYEGYQPLRPEDIADIIVYSASVPSHVNINEIIVTPVAQAGIGVIHKTQVGVNS